MPTEQKPLAVIYEDANASAAKSLAEALKLRYQFSTAIFERPQGRDSYLLNTITHLAVSVIFYHANQPSDEAELIALHQRQLPLVVVKRDVGGATGNLQEMYDRLSALPGNIKLVDRMELPFQLHAILTALRVV